MAEEKPRKRGRGVPREELEKDYPSLTYLAGPPAKATKKAWVAAFNARPDAMHSLLADFIKQVHAQPGRIGQRPMPREEQVDFQALVYGEETVEPLQVVLPKLTRSLGVSVRTFCTAIRMSRTQYQRLLAGDYDPDVGEIRLIAQAVRKPPTYFMEYRKAMAVAAFLNLIDENPQIATTLYRQYLEVRIR